MNEPGFHSLLYTDCRPGQGLRGGGGFQFQAVSAGTSDEAMTVAQRAALYEAPVSWMRDKRPAADYPPSLAHVFDGIFVTARGIYLGAEVDGVREGNQFTHAIATSDAQHYGLVRPAQMWGAPWWTEQPAPATECDAIPAEPEAGPWGVDVIRDWVLSQPDGQKWLLALHSALEQLHVPGGKRILFVGEDPADVVRWIAAGTLLLPQEHALRVGFRVYATNPQYSRHEVLALHPDWASAFVKDNEFVVCDLVDGRPPEIRLCESSQHWVPRFLRCDPFDVVDAVELAYQFASQNGRDLAGAGDRIASSILTLGEYASDQTTVLAEWLASCRPESIVEVQEQVTDTVLAEAPPLPVLRTLAQVPGPATVQARVRHMFLWAQVDAVVHRQRYDHEAAVPGLPWTPEDQERAADLVEAAAHHVAPENVRELLRIARRFGITLRVNKFRDPAASFVSWWADHPASDVDLQKLACESEIVDLLRGELAMRLQDARAQKTTADVGTHWCALLARTISDPEMPLDALIASTAVERGGQPRRDAIAAFRTRLEDLQRPDMVWSVLFDRSAPTLDEIHEFLSALPAPAIPKSLAHKVFMVLNLSRLEPGSLDVVQQLADHIGPDQGTLREICAGDQKLRRWLNGFQHGPPGLAKASDLLPEVPEQVFAARSDEVLDALLKASLLDAADAVAYGGQQFQELVVQQLTAIWSENTTDNKRRNTALALGFLLSEVQELDSLHTRLDSTLRSWTREHKQNDYQQVRQLLLAADPQTANRWYDWLKADPLKADKPKMSLPSWLPGRRKARGN